MMTFTVDVRTWRPGDRRGEHVDGTAVRSTTSHRSTRRSRFRLGEASAPVEVVVTRDLGGTRGVVHRRAGQPDGAVLADAIGVGTIVDDDICDVVGTDGDDTLIGTPADETICGFGGDDVIDGGGGNDTILAGPASTQSCSPHIRAQSQSTSTTAQPPARARYSLDSIENATGTPGSDRSSAMTAQPAHRARRQRHHQRAGR